MPSETAMLLLTVLASVVAIAAAYIARGAREEAKRSADAAERSAKVAEDTHDIEAERRWEELKPTFTASVEMVNQVRVLRLECGGPMDYTQVTFEIPEGQEVIEGIQLPGFEDDDSDGFHRAGPLGAFDYGQVRTFPLRESRGGEALIVLYCYRGEEASWMTDVRCDVPPTPRVYSS